jgi:hypothetical protein
MPGIPMALTVDARSLLLNRIPHLQLLVLFGSRARCDHNDRSDWDFAVLYDHEVQKQLDRDHPYSFLAIYIALAETFNISEERIDVVDLDHASELIAHLVAQDGQLLYESHSETFADFQTRSLMSPKQLHQHHQQSRQIIEQFLISQGV